MTTPTQYSFGRVCSLTQRLPGAVRDAVKELGIEPVVIIDDMPHFSAEQVERIAVQLGSDRRTRNILPARGPLRSGLGSGGVSEPLC